MVMYAGETIIFKTSATDADKAKTVITDADVTSAVITVVDTADDSVLVNAAAMTWDSTDLDWQYVWTTPATAGTYRAKMNLIAATFDTWEIEKVKTKTGPNGL